MSVVDDLQIYGITYSDDTTDSTSSSTGSMIILGGVGIAQALHTGGQIETEATTASTSTTTGALVSGGGLGVAGASYMGGVVNATDTTNSTSTTTGSVVVSGGLGIASDSYLGGIVNATDTTNSTSTTTGSVVVSGGLGIASDSYLGGVVNAVNTTGSTSGSTGAVIVSGGLGVGENIFATGIIESDSTTASTSTTTGAIVSNGGLGVAGASFFGGIMNIDDTTASTSTTTGALVVDGGVGMAGDLYVGGDITCGGTTTTINSTDILIADRFMGLGVGNSTDMSDLGIWMQYSRVGANDAKYAGLFRDNSDSNAFILFEECTDDLEEGVNTLTTFTRADLKVKDLDVSGTLTANINITSWPFQIVNDSGVGGTEFAGGAYNVSSNPERYIYANNTSVGDGDVDVFLPAITTSGQFVFIAKVGSNTGANVTITASGSDKIETAVKTTLLLKRQYMRVTLTSYIPASGPDPPIWLIT